MVTETPASGISEVLSVTTPRTTWVDWADAARIVQISAMRMVNFFIASVYFRHKLIGAIRGAQWKRSELSKDWNEPALIHPGTWVEFVLLWYALEKRQDRVR